MEATETVALREAASNRRSPRRNDVANECTIPVLFLAATRERGAQTAMRWKHRGIWQAVAWAEYGAAVREVGCALVAFGLQRGERVAILSENRPEWLYIDLGAQSVGCVAVGIDVSAPIDRAADIINDCGARVLFVDSAEQLDAVGVTLAKTPVLECIVHFASRVGRVETHVRVVDLARFRNDGRQFDEGHPGRWEMEIGRARADDIAIIAYGPASGAARLTHSDLVRQVDGNVQSCPGANSDEQLSVLSLSQVEERCFTTYRSLATGSIVNFAEGPDNLVDGLREVAPHVAMATPPIWEMLQATITAAIADASPLGRLVYRLAVDPDLASTDRTIFESRLPTLGSVIARALVLNRVKSMIGLRRARVLVCNGAPMPSALLHWYRALGLNIVEARDGEGWRPSGASDTLADKESR
jgi:long-chain acyl-CoA synthetase